MGTRGVIRQPDSVRGLREKIPPPDEPEMPVCPKWLSKSGKKEFHNLVTMLTAAKVPIKQVDCYAVAMAATCVSGVAEWTSNEQTSESLREKIDCSKLVARYQKDSLQWLNLICATPTARARIGLRSTAKKDGPLAQLLERKKGAQDS